MCASCARGGRQLIPTRRAAGMAGVAALVLVGLAVLPAHAGAGPAKRASEDVLERPAALFAPPPGGLTVGFAGTSSVDGLIRAQPFTVESIAVFETEAQRLLVYVPDAPPLANTLTDEALTPDTVVFVRRAGILDRIAEPRLWGDPRMVPVTGTPSALAAPPPGGITLGAAGTNDVEALIAAQPFEVNTVAAFDVANQRWLMHVVGAPPQVNTLTRATLRPYAVVVMRRAEEQALRPAEPAGEVPLVDEPGRSGGVATLSYYYCQRGSQRAGWGDGGGFCGHMKSGARVYEGAAACAREHQGQRFRIAGDPLGRVYTCEDTGNAVRGNHRDIFFHNSDDGLRWLFAVGRRAEIFILD